MKKDRAVEQKMDEVLSSLDKISRAGADHFFYTRLTARLNEQEHSVWMRVSGFLARPLVIASFLIAVIAGNYLVFSTQDDTSVKTGYAEVAQDDYNLQSITYYDPETP
jgi:hypothetical protein